MDPSNVTNVLGAFALRVAGEVLAAAADAEHDASAIGALVHLSKYPGSSIEDLRAPTLLSHSGCVRVIDRLVATGLVERRSGEDARAVALHLTRKGRSSASGALARREDVLGRILHPLSKPEREVFGRLLGRMMSAEVRTLPSALRACRLCNYEACQECPVAQTEE